MTLQQAGMCLGFCPLTQALLTQGNPSRFWHITTLFGNEWRGFSHSITCPTLAPVVTDVPRYSDGLAVLFECDVTVKRYVLDLVCCPSRVCW